MTILLAGYIEATIITLPIKIIISKPCCDNKDIFFRLANTDVNLKRRHQLYDTGAHQHIKELLAAYCEFKDEQENNPLFYEGRKENPYL